ncbi:hypothetical protein LIER_17828 [Lithospermum erythrorhizon]|uniref:Uncharacterized protein n=1 Tax=Lithospermum erythrorhizon TaxID=34254 RepID=A0AAV3QBS9_LITER
MVQTFHNGLTPSTRTILDVSIGGAFDKKIPDEAYVLLEELSANQHQPHPIAHTRRVVGVLEINEKTKLEAHIASLTIQLEQLRNGHGVQGSHSMVPLFILCGETTQIFLGVTTKML